jgi:hypothetical protein
MRTSKRRAPLLTLAVAAKLTLAAQVATANITGQVNVVPKFPVLRPDTPVPAEPNMLFYLQRSLNANTVVYAANMRGSGFDVREPVSVFWRLYKYPGAPKDSLTFIERTLAYGVRVKTATEKMASAEIISLPGREVEIDLDGEGRPEAVITMGSHRAKLVSVYLNIDNRGLIPRVIWADICGVDKATGQYLSEHLSPPF